jgi:hypothetical protein
LRWDAHAPGAGSWQFFRPDRGVGGPVSPAVVGLCGTCRFARVVRSARGSTFWLCERSVTDARFPRYPALPVVRCAGFEPAPAARDDPDGTPPHTI